MFRALRAYMETLFTSDLYTLIDSFPEPDEMQTRMPLEKTLVHIDIDNIEPIVFGLGDNLVDALYDNGAGTVEEWEARCHEVTFDIGVWASAETGGVTARMEARELLDKLFVGSTAYEACQTTTDGVEILGFSGGQNIIDTVGDVKVFRTIGLELVVRIFSRIRRPVTEFIDVIEQDPQNVIDGNVTITG
jgi:hypothetical protein